MRHSTVEAISLSVATSIFALGVGVILGMELVEPRVVIKRVEVPGPVQIIEVPADEPQDCPLIIVPVDRSVPVGCSDTDALNRCEWLKDRRLSSTVAPSHNFYLSPEPRWWSSDR